MRGQGAGEPGVDVGLDVPAGAAGELGAYGFDPFGRSAWSRVPRSRSTWRWLARAELRTASRSSTSGRRPRRRRRARPYRAKVNELLREAANRKRKGSRGGRPVSHDADLYKEKNTVERLINKLKAWRGMATRYDKTPQSHLPGLHLGASTIWIKDFTRSDD
ncbi:hypothetical protein [Streptomyces sp. NPDC051109]|uniref:hypothetical protein n=1 Tax=Streptomyces sp. NPDC051109 TaxID=3365642 RepID=UPI003795B939